MPGFLSEVGKNKALYPCAADSRKTCSFAAVSCALVSFAEEILDKVSAMLLDSSEARLPFRFAVIRLMAQLQSLSVEAPLSRHR